MTRTIYEIYTFHRLQFFQDVVNVSEKNYKILVSYAQSTNEIYLATLQISFTLEIKSKGPKMDPGEVHIKTTGIRSIKSELL